MFLDIPIEEIDEGYSRLRFADPRSEANLLSSIKKYGQVSPVIVFGVSSHRYEMVDGFKRLRALRKLKYKTLQAKTLDTGSKTIKTAMIFMNWEIRSITDLEEGMVISSLHREDSLSQTAIAMMLGRHKSWVCRRIALVERLSDEVLDNIKLGLINPTIGRELSKLPRGNQQIPLETILKHRFTSRQTVNLVSMLQEEPAGNHEAILNGLNKDSLEKLNQGNPKKTKKNHSSRECGWIDAWREKLNLLENHLALLLKDLNSIPRVKIENEEQKQILSIISRIARLFDDVRLKLKTTADLS